MIDNPIRKVEKTRRGNGISRRIEVCNLRKDGCDDGHQISCECFARTGASGQLEKQLKSLFYTAACFFPSCNPQFSFFFCLSFVFCLFPVTGGGRGYLCLLALLYDFSCSLCRLHAVQVGLRHPLENVMDDFFLLVRVVASAYVMSWRAVIIA